MLYECIIYLTIITLYDQTTEIQPTILSFVIHFKQKHLAMLKHVKLMYLVFDM